MVTWRRPAGQPDGHTMDRFIGVHRRKPVPEATERVHDRTQCNPVTSEPDYSDEDTIFLRAIDTYKTENRRPFPT
jgi:hypothetical protein